MALIQIRQSTFINSAKVRLVEYCSDSLVLYSTNMLFCKFCIRRFFCPFYLLTTLLYTKLYTDIALQKLMYSLLILFATVNND